MPIGRSFPRRAAWAIPPAVYAIVTAIYFVRYLGSRFSTALFGSSSWAQDNILLAGILEWGYRSLWSASRSIFEWTAGYPVANTLPGAENLIGWQILYTPMRWLGIENVAAFNLIALLSFVISGIGMALLARQFGANAYGALLSGFVPAFVPYHLMQIVQISNLAICWAPFALLYLDRFLSSGRLPDGIGLASAFLLTLLSGMYFGVFLAIVAAFYLGFAQLAGYRRLWRPISLGLAAVALGCLVVLAPVLVAYGRFARDHHYEHGATEISRHSLSPQELVHASRWQPIWAGTRFQPPGGLGGAFPGVVALGL